MFYFHFSYSVFMTWNTWTNKLVFSKVNIPTFHVSENINIITLLDLILEVFWSKIADERLLSVSSGLSTSSRLESLLGFIKIKSGNLSDPNGFKFSEIFTVIAHFYVSSLQIVSLRKHMSVRLWKHKAHLHCSLKSIHLIPVCLNIGIHTPGP